MFRTKGHYRGNFLSRSRATNGIGSHGPVVSFVSPVNFTVGRAPGKAGAKKDA
ncbi:hypothetical protein ABIF83_007254 [Bradyrhizobium ottawaense]